MEFSKIQRDSWREPSHLRCSPSMSLKVWRSYAVSTLQWRSSMWILPASSSAALGLNSALLAPLRCSHAFSGLTRRAGKRSPKCWDSACASGFRLGESHTVAKCSSRCLQSWKSTEETWTRRAAKWLAKRSAESAWNPSSDDRPTGQRMPIREQMKGSAHTESIPNTFKRL